MFSRPVSSLLLLLALHFLQLCELAKINKSIPTSHEGQWLDCTTIRSAGKGQNKSTCGDEAQVEANRSATNAIPSNPLSGSPTTTSPAYILSIDFNNILKRRQISQNENCTGNQLQTADVVCTPKQIFDSNNRAIAITIVPSNADYDSTVGASILNLKAGSANVIRCQFSLLQSSNVTELDFKLRWLRAVTSQQGLKNQSISSDENGHPQNGHHQISVSMNRVWTAQREGGLDLLLNDIKTSDSGDYFCQALASDEGILDEKRIHLEISGDANESQDRASPRNGDDASSIYSIENLEKLLPSLQIIPDYSELALGETIQLACVTSGLDPDPEPDRIEWTFEPFERPGYVPDGVDLQLASVNSTDMPTNTSQLGNILVVWSMSYETIGIYKCSYHMEDLNLTAEASGELALRPSADSAPLVYITPELLRLSAKGSAKVQCESTGYPPPLMEWYRVDAPNVTEALKDGPDARGLQQPSEDAVRPSGSSLDNLDGLEVHHLRSRDAMAYCQQSGCRAIDNLDPSKRQQVKQQRHKTLITGLSWIQIDQARAHHQGQYVCKATNKHGSNQASSIVDVEFKEVPQVDIPEEHRLKTIVLDSSGDNSSKSTGIHSVTFNCSIKAGQPVPRLKWLRTNLPGSYSRHHKSDIYAAANILAGHQSSRLKPSSSGSNNLEIYDLTSVSSATSKVSTWSHDGGKSLTLQLSTISIDDEGDYVCLGENELGRHSAVAHLVVRKPPQVRILQTSPKIFRPNDSFQLDCLVSGHPSPVDIEWSRSDRGAFFALISRHPLAMSADQERAVLKFDRVTSDDSGEYTCAARDPLNQAIILKDTIMLMAEEFPDKTRGDQMGQGADDMSRQLPKLLVRPTKITAELGSNVTLDCLAVSGLQPTVVEWLAPSNALASHSSGQSSEHMPIRPYYRSQMMSLAQDGQHSSLLQFGSRLKLFNVSKAHEGVYQCKGRNKVGTENAPAFVEILDNNNLTNDGSGDVADSKLDGDSSKSNTSGTKTKIAKMGTNIELRCQVNGIEGQPATSWSRENRELPATSVQIDHNLWIQNLTKADEGMYLCAARSSEPNEILQARIRLLVNEDGVNGRRLANGKYDPATLNAKIIASKTHLVEGDSVTLECVINLIDGASNTSSGSTTSSQSPPSHINSGDLAELERQVIWTNLHSGQSLFQDNVYIQNNLLIVYNLKKENSATYRCNYNDLTQFTDHKLQVTHGENQSASSSMTSFLQNATFSTRQQQQHFENLPDDQNITQFLFNVFQTKHIVAPFGAKRVLECGSKETNTKYFWTRDQSSLLRHNDNVSTATRTRIGQEMEPLVLDQIETSHAGLYQCNRPTSSNGTRYKIESQFLVEVPVVAAKFVQRPVSFVTLPAVSDADHQLELELKFYPENEHGLMLFSGGVLNNIVISNQQAASDTNSSVINNKTSTSLTNADYISLGMVRGYLEFRFELGDGATLVRSLQPVELNRWHKVIIERNRRGAAMWLDGQDPSSNSSMGKFFNLDLDSLLYVGGHQVFLSISNYNSNSKRQNSSRKYGNQTNTDRTSNASVARSFYGFTRGFRGCISSLRINQRELNLMARNRSVAVGIFECDKSECPPPTKSEMKMKGQFECPSSRGLCQVDRSSPKQPIQQQQQASTASSSMLAKRLQSLPTTDLRCICFPTLGGIACNESAQQPAEDWVPIESIAEASTLTPTTISGKTNPVQTSACDLSSQCNRNGTEQCEPLSSSIYKCHCKLGFTGEHCNQLVTYANETSVGLNQSAFIQFAFNSAQEVGMAQTNHQRSGDAVGWQQPSSFNETDYSRLITFTEQQNISFRVKTRSSYGLLFYIGQDPSPNRMSLAKIDSGGYQTSKSIVANALARLSATKVSDFLAVALVDGHIELSYELGSGLAVLRSSKRYNDAEWHKIEITRLGKASKLIIDDAMRDEAQSPGKLSMLNVGQDIYLGGLPATLQTLLSTSSSRSLLSSFMGCLSDLQINSLGPVNLVRSDHLTRMKSARNLVPCSDSLLSTPQISGNNPLVSGDKISIDQMVIKAAPATAEGRAATAAAAADATQATTTFGRTTRKPTKPSYTTTEGDDDDSDELARSS